MKYLFLLLLTSVLTYDRNAAVRYAYKYYNRANHDCKKGRYDCTPYAYYGSDLCKYGEGPGDCANFVSQCLIAGGLGISSCSGSYGKGGTVPYVPYLQNCLVSKGWKNSGSMPSSGMPKGSVITYYNGGHVAIVVEGGKYPKIAAHTTDVYGKGYDYASGRHYYWP